jgi:putative NADH-flavin reductase
MRITVLGATGRTGIPLVRRAVERGHEVVAFVRSPEKLDVTDDALTVIEGDAYTGEGLAEAIEGPDAIASVLGQSSSGPDDLLTVAGNHAIEAMDEDGVGRFVTLVGAGVRLPGESVSLTGRIVGTALKLLQPEVLEDAENHVAAVRESGLDWTVVRAPRLSEKPGTGEFEAGDVTPGRKAIPREDVATFVLDCIEEGTFVNELPRIAPR